MEQSINNFLQDYLCRNGSSIDNNYMFLSDLHSSDSNIRAIKLYGRIYEFLFEFVKLTRDGYNYQIPNKITFDFKLGWIIETETVKCFLGKLSIEHEMKIRIGHGSYFSGEVFLHGSGELVVGNFCGIAAGTHLYTSEDKHPLGYMSHFNFSDTRRTPALGLSEISPNFGEFTNRENLSIGNSVWIGRDVTIKQGLSIGNGSVIGEKSYVNKSIESFVLYGGIPAKLIRKLVNDKIAGQLQKMAWWHWSNEKILKHKALFEHPLGELDEEFDKYFSNAISE